VAADASPGAKWLGRGGEAVALLLLAAKGYRIRHRNWRGPSGELDLVAERGGRIVFVEVKARSSELFGGAAAAFGRAKQTAVVRTAAAYLSRYDLWERPCRFDLVTVERTAGPPWWRIRHVENAVTPDLGRLMA